VAARNAGRSEQTIPIYNLNNCVGDFTGSQRQRRAPGSGDATRGHRNERPSITTNVLFMVVNELTYSSGGRWSKWADGGGKQPRANRPETDNRLAANWADSDEIQKHHGIELSATGTIDNGNNTRTSSRYCRRARGMSSTMWGVVDRRRESNCQLRFRIGRAGVDRRRLGVGLGLGNDRKAMEFEDPTVSGRLTAGTTRSIACAHRCRRPWRPERRM
jgi:hypothetical protein